MSHLRKTMNVNTIEVAYFLVCPEDKSQDHRHQYQWQMPLDWDKSVEINDHRGHVYSLRIPEFIGDLPE